MKTLWMMTLVAMGAMVSQAQAGHHCGCPSCGCSNIKKVCRLVPDVKKTTTFCYDCKCEDFCIPGPSKCCGWKCVPNNCPCTGSHKEPNEGKPCYCGHVRTRKVLIKIPVTKETKVWTCKVDARAAVAAVRNSTPRPRPKPGRRKSCLPRPSKRSSWTRTAASKKAWK